MKKIYALVLMFSLAVAGYAQMPDLRWANGFGGPAGTPPAGDEMSVKMAPDDSGNVYVVGHFTGTVDFDPGVGVASLVSVGDSDIFVAKYGKSGELIWNFRIGGAGPDEALGISLKSDTFYITGSFSRDSVDFDPIVGGSYLSSHGGKDIFVAMFDTTGFLFWCHGIGFTGNDVANSIAVDDSGNVILTGSFQSNVDFDPGAGVANLNTGGAPSDAFVAKYSNAGAFRFAFDFGGGTTAEAGLDVATDDSGNVFAVGQFQGSSIDFDPDPVATAFLNSHGNYDGYVASYDVAGHYRWAFSLGGLTNFSDRCTGIAIDTGGNVLITGRFTGQADFDPGAGVVNLNSPGGNDAFIAKYDNNGIYSWAYQVGGGSSNDEGLDITANVYNNYVLVTGYFVGVVDFNPGGPVANLTSAGDEDIFVAAYEPGGAYAWAFNAGGVATDNGVSINTNLDLDTPRVRLYVGGNFSSIADFKPGVDTSTLTSRGGRDLFIAQYIDPYPVGIQDIPSSQATFSLYPNPAQTQLYVVFGEPVPSSELRITDMNGRLVHQQLVSGKSVFLDVSSMDAGIYLVSLTGKNSISHSRFSVIK